MLGYQALLQPVHVVVYLLVGQQPDPQTLQLLLDLLLWLLWLRGQGISSMLEGAGFSTGHAMIEVGVSKRLTRVSISLWVPALPRRFQFDFSSPAACLAKFRLQC